MLSHHTVLADLRAPVPGDTLPGLFAENPHPWVNGSLWTLPVEVTAYALLALGGLLAMLWRRLPARAVAVAAFVGACALAVWAGGELTYPLFAAFAGGALLYVLRSRLTLDPRLFALAVGLWIASYQLPLAAQVLLAGLSLPYAVMFLGFRGLEGLRWLVRPGDVSYGVYIYAWPIAQLAVQATGTRSPALVVILSAVATYILALASWRLVERPALRLKRHLSRPGAGRGVGRADGPGRPAGSDRPGRRWPVERPLTGPAASR